MSFESPLGRFFFALWNQCNVNADNLFESSLVFSPNTSEEDVFGHYNPTLQADSCCSNKLCKLA